MQIFQTRPALFFLVLRKKMHLRFYCFPSCVLNIATGQRVSLKFTTFPGNQQHFFLTTCFCLTNSQPRAGEWERALLLHFIDQTKFSSVIFLFVSQKNAPFLKSVGDLMEICQNCIRAKFWFLVALFAAFVVVLVVVNNTSHVFKY